MHICIDRYMHIFILNFSHECQSDLHKKLHESIEKLKTCLVLESKNAVYRLLFQEFNKGNKEDNDSKIGNENCIATFINQFRVLLKKNPNKWSNDTVEKMTKYYKIILSMLDKYHMEYEISIIDV